MKKILVLGGTGSLGKVLIQTALKKKYHVITLVRTPAKLRISDPKLTIMQGDVTDKADLSFVLSDVDAVISTLGHGFRTPFPIQEKTLSVLIPLMKIHGIKRFVTITGAGLKVTGDPFSLTGTLSDMLFPLIDPPRMRDAKMQQTLLEKSTLDWTVVRTPVHNDRNDQTISHVGMEQPFPWQTLSRKAIAAFMLECLEKNTWIKKAPIIS